jgi:mannosyltransferase OCH1-like enzyme
MTIPKIIHQIWFDLGKGAQVPEKYNQFRESWKACHPDAECILWTREKADKFLLKHYPWFCPTYNQYKQTIFQIDALRLCILDHFGGIYADMDVECYKSLDSLLENPKINLVLTQPSMPVISKLRTKYQLTNFFYASCPQHPFIRYCLYKQIEKSRSLFNSKHTAVGPLLVTGPLFLTFCLRHYGIRPDMCIISADTNAYFKHHGHGSWIMGKNIAHDGVKGLLIAFVVIFVLFLIGYGLKGLSKDVRKLGSRMNR